MFSPGHLPGAIKTGPCMRNYIVIFLENDTMENQESSANTEVPFDVTEITADDINMEGIEGMEGIINTSTQSRDIYRVQLKCRKP